MVTTGVRIEAGGVLKNLETLLKRIDGRDRAIMRYGRRLMESDTTSAFTSGRSPTGRAWKKRKHSYPWPILRHTGTLQDIVEFSYGIKTKDKKLKFFGKVKDGVCSGAYTRGGGGVAMGAQKPWIVVVGAIHFGRQRARSTARWKRKAHGFLRTRGKMVFHGGGTKLEGTGPSSGKVPARPLFGFSRSSRKQLKRYAEKRLARVFK